MEADLGEKPLELFGSCRDTGHFQAVSKGRAVAAGSGWLLRQVGLLLPSRVPPSSCRAFGFARSCSQNAWVGPAPRSLVERDERIAAYEGYIEKRDGARTRACSAGFLCCRRHRGGPLHARGERHGPPARPALEVAAPRFQSFQGTGWSPECFSVHLSGGPSAA